MAEDHAIPYDDILVDAAAYYLVVHPEKFDVLVTTNLFGDILSDEAAGVIGSLGLCASANLGERYALFEPIHGSAPKRAGLNMANPIATILTAAMMLRHSMALEKEAQAVEKAVLDALVAGYRTYDIVEEGKTRVGTREMGDVIAKAIKA